MSKRCGPPARGVTLRLIDQRKLAYVTQTTLSVDDTRDTIAALTRRFPASSEIEMMPRVEERVRFRRRDPLARRAKA